MDLIPEAVSAAKESDVVIACLGDLAGLFQSGTVGEGSDTDSLNLPGVQQQLLEALVATGKPVIVVMTGGRPYNLQAGREGGRADDGTGAGAGRGLGDCRCLNRPRGAAGQAGSERAEKRRGDAVLL